MKFNVITVFPNLILDYCDESILGRAQGENIIEVNAVNLRDFTDDKHGSVDDTPYGGGAGMVMKAEPIYRALERLGALRADTATLQHCNTATPSAGVLECSSAGVKKTILLSPRGRQFDQRLAEEWAKLDEITFVCGRYEGVDQRVADYMADEEVSIGPYVLAGGELGALVIIEAVSRLLPGVLGNPASLAEETFSTSTQQQTNTTTPGAEVLQCSSAVVEYPQYTKPEDFMGWKVPDILLSGHHKHIAEWRKSSPPKAGPPVAEKKTPS
jgi:tRNA (guanine37-N1)-methyltransferase